MSSRSSSSPSSPSLAERSLAAVWHPCTQMQQAMASPPLEVARASGHWLYTPQGDAVFDGISSWWVNLFGHADPGINHAIKDQLDQLPHTLLAGCTHAPAVALAERLSARTGGHLGHCFYASDGASAIEVALKMSHHSWVNQGLPEKRGFLCLGRSYHGETLGALAVTDVAVFRNAYQRLLMPAQILQTPAPTAAEVLQAQSAPQGISPLDTQAAWAQCALKALEAALAQDHARIAALVLEPMVQAAGGMGFYSADYLRGARALCTRYQVHLIADEIAVGCGRTGHFFAHEHAWHDPSSSDPTTRDPSLWPDLICLSKGITGGTLPLSLVLSRHAIFESFLSDDISRGFLHSHSYTGNPLACRAALAVLDRFDQTDVLGENVRAFAGLEAALSQAFSASVAFQSGPLQLVYPRRMGSIWAADLMLRPDPLHTALPPDFPSVCRRVALAHGLLLRPIGQTIYLMPPYGLTNSHVNFLAERLPRILQAAVEACTQDARSAHDPSPRPAEPAAA